MGRFLSLLIAITLSALTLTPPQTRGQNHTPPARDKFRRVQDHIPDQYIVVLKDDVPAADVASHADGLSRAHGGLTGHVYTHALKGFSARMPEAAARALSMNPHVEYVEEDGLASATVTQLNPPSWGLDRIDQRDLPLNNAYTYASNITGAGVNAYVLDTGIKPTHADFGGRAFMTADFINDGWGGVDCHGHGTHVAGTLGGASYGVAKGVRIRAVRVLGCNGQAPFSSVIAGVDWVTANHVKPAVANMSLGGSANDALDTAVRNSIASGVTYVVAAGNFGSNAGGFSPARVSEALTVANSTISDTMAGTSNGGPVVDLFAPGTNITSAWIGPDTATSTRTGTSMASPHVAGVAALYLQANPGAAPATVNSAIVNQASVGKVSDIFVAGTPNRLLYSSLPLPPPPLRISGRVTNAAGVGLASVNMTLTGSQTASVQTDSSGNYLFTGLTAGGSYTVTASLAGYTFSPPGRSYANLNASHTAQNFTGMQSTSEEVVWVEDQDSMPVGAGVYGDGESWNWISGSPAPFSGSWAHQSGLVAGMHQHLLYNATQLLLVGAGDTLVTYVYLDPANPPSEVMLQWNAGRWEHRAYWGANLINWGVDGTASRRYMGPLPPAGQWVRLEVPASAVGLEGQALNGIAFTLYDGRATWDRSGKVTTAAALNAPSNVALWFNEASVSASSTYSDSYSLRTVNNGDRKGLNWGANGGWKDATPGAYPDWVQIDFSGSKMISEIDVYTLQDAYANPVEPDDSLTFSSYGITDFSVQYWDGVSWVTVPGGSVSGNNKVWRKFTFSPITTSMIRVLVHGALDGYSRIVEVEAYEGATPPQGINVALVANGATASASSTLDAGRAAAAAINGDRGGLPWGSDPSTGSGWHDATQNAYPDWLEVTFAGQRTVSEVSVFSVQDNFGAPAEPTEAMTFSQYGLQDFDVEYWTGSAWAVVPGGAVTNNNKVWVRLLFAPLTTNKLRVVARRGGGGYSRIVEVEAY
jgi:subtilisin family serine protease